MRQPVNQNIILLNSGFARVIHQERKDSDEI